MFRVSTILKNTRLDKELEFSEISKKLKIPAKYLEAIEDEKIANFPQEPYCSLIVKDYANFLGLNGEEILSLVRRDFAQKVKIVKSGNPFFVFTFKHIKTGINTVSAVGSSQKIPNHPTHLTVFILNTNSVTKMLENGRQIICLTANHLSKCP